MLTHTSCKKRVSPRFLYLTLSERLTFFLRHDGVRKIKMAAPTKSGSGDASVVPPHLEWAQRRDKLWITVILENCKDEKHEFKSNSFFFRGTGGTENLPHEVTLELYGEIDPEKSVCRRLNDRQLQYTLFKTEASASWWPRLNKKPEKLHFLKTDFNRWKDEDDTDDEDKEDFNLDEMMNSMGGLNGADFGGGATGEEQGEEDSDDEELPDLQ